MEDRAKVSGVAASGYHRARASFCHLGVILQARKYEKAKSAERRVPLQDQEDAKHSASKTAAIYRRVLEIGRKSKALRTDDVAIWHLHASDTPDSITDEAVEAQEILKKQGKTLFIGFFAHDINAVVARIH